jgi:hypothetical protein
VNQEECLPRSNASMQIPKILFQIYYYNIARKKLIDDDELGGSLLSFVIKENPS